MDQKILVDLIVLASIYLLSVITVGIWSAKGLKEDCLLYGAISWADLTLAILAAIIPVINTIFAAFAIIEWVVHLKFWDRPAIRCKRKF